MLTSLYRYIYCSRPGTPVGCDDAVRVSAADRHGGLGELHGPLYLGATSDQMSLGAVQLTQTSMPIGGTDTNCVIAAHRGAWSSAMFRDIEDLDLDVFRDPTTR